MESYNQTLEFMYCVISPRNPINKTSKGIRWEKPPLGWKKLNTDGSSISCMERAGCGGVIKDELGNWVAEFTRHIEATNNFAAELWGLRDGLMLCCNLNKPCLIVELE
nr:putative ribonuclease h protein [Quercus suber]